MRNFKITIEDKNGLDQELQRLNSVRFDSVRKKNVAELLNRARKNKNTTLGGTPVDTGELRLSSSSNLHEMGYTKEYAPHVEYGHRTKNGNWVPGQRFLQKNVQIQQEIYVEDLRKAIKKG